MSSRKGGMNRPTAALENWVGLALLVGHQTCDSQVTGLGVPAGHHRIVALGKLFTPVCLSPSSIIWCTGQETVTFFGWEGNRRPGGK